MPNHPSVADKLPPSPEGLRVALLGEAGAFHHAAARLHMEATTSAAALNWVFCPSADEVLAALHNGTADRALLAVENNLAGPIPGHLLRIDTAGVHIRSECRLQVELHLYARPELRLKDIHRVVSHPVALAESGDFLDRNPVWSRETTTDTARAARLAAEAAPEEGLAAICGTTAGELHGLKRYAERIDNRMDNVTRFVELGRGDFSSVRSTSTTPDSSSDLSPVHAVVLALFTAAAALPGLRAQLEQAGATLRCHCELQHAEKQASTHEGRFYSEWEFASARQANAALDGGVFKGMPARLAGIFPTSLGVYAE